MSNTTQIPCRVGDVGWFLFNGTYYGDFIDVIHVRRDGVYIEAYGMNALNGSPCEFALNTSAFITKDNAANATKRSNT